MGTHRQGGDRLSALPAKALERILSHLPSDEAARASTLSRRWRGVSDSVPVVDLVDGKLVHLRGPGWRLPLCFDQQVTSAVLSKDPGTPIRVFRLRALQAPADMLHQWILIAATSGTEEIDLELRYRGSSRRTICPFGRSARASADFGDDVRGSYTKTPRQLFCCYTLRRLRLANWTLDLPGGVLFAASLQTLCLKRIMARGEVLQQLVAGCPCLADLTLEECPGVTDITVGSPRLRRFAMVCCHNATSVVLPTERLRSLHYKGCRPYDLQFLDVPTYDDVTSMTVDICDDLTCKGSHEVAPVLELISRCKSLTYLHLALRPSMTCYSSEFMAVAHGLSKLKQLVLKGCMATEHAIRSVTLLLVDTQHLEVLTLFPLGPKRPKKKFDCSDDDSDSDVDESCSIDNGDDDGHDYKNGDGHDYYNGNDEGHNYGNGSNGHNHDNGDGHNYGNGNGHNYYDDDGDYDNEDYDDDYNYDDADDNSNGENYNDGDDYEMFRDMWRMGIPCFSHSLKKITIAKYSGSGLDRILANFLLSKGRALEEFTVTLSAQLSPHKEEIATEFRSWLCNPSATYQAEYEKHSMIYCIIYSSSLSFLYYRA
uniref:Uncharacterized protein n=1 Tax=Avena sativa TaxID=4498 RepID=A0ACD5YBH8_AVESA